MAAVVGGMTVIQLLELIATVNGGALSLVKIVEELRKQGAKDTDTVPTDSVTVALDNLIDAINSKLPLPLH